MITSQFPSKAILASVLSACVIGAPGFTWANPYVPIVERNVFALKPPASPVTTPLEQATPPPNIELRGISTLFGRPQVLLTIKNPAKPPEPPKDHAVILDVGQREGDVEILEITPTAGAVRLRIQGKEISLTLADNAVKPQSPSPATAAIPPSGGALPLPGVPSLGKPSGSGGAITYPNPVPNSQPAVNPASPALPTRTLRGNQSRTQTMGGFNDPVEQAAAIEVMAEANRKKIEAGIMPPPPITGFRRHE